MSFVLVCPARIRSTQNFICSCFVRAETTAATSAAMESRYSWTREGRSGISRYVFVIVALKPVGALVTGTLAAYLAV